jgi:prepilin-type N-terminal cleavage/methylation domain-containing protein
MFPHRYRNASRDGFTLIELLIVVAIIGILLGLLSGAIKETVANAKKKKIEAERVALTTAIVNYWHDYGRWPHEEGEEQSADNNDDKRLRYYGKENWKVFNRLAAKNRDGNPLGKSYIDETALTTTTGNDGAGSRIGLAKKRNNTFTSTDRSTLVHGDNKPYWVTFDLVQNTASVSLNDPR